MVPLADGTERARSEVNPPDEIQHTRSMARQQSESVATEFGLASISVYQWSQTMVASCGPAGMEVPNRSYTQSGESADHRRALARSCSKRSITNR